MRHPAAAGFTLIEVLVALVIVAVGMAAVMSALSSSASTVNFLRDETFANWVALNKIATLRLSGQQPQTGTTDGDVDFGNRSWHWRQEVVTTDLPGVLRIEVKVRPKEVKAGDDAGWTTSVMGICGNSVGMPDGYNPNWGAQAPRYGTNPNGTGTTTGNSNQIGANGGLQMAPSSGSSGTSTLGSDSGTLGGSSNSTLGSGSGLSNSDPDSTNDASQTQTPTTPQIRP
ncbi:MAG: type II secretion system minor pseudopilin GspI [Proteobacteria bacterium]|nr:type II secretion system minor pseudopilin GspI [Pseudomonadota bacterium]